MIDMAQADRRLRTNKQTADRVYSVVNEETGVIVSKHNHHSDAIRAVIRASIDTHMIVCEHQA
jgi:hypothetical protein